MNEIRIGSWRLLLIKDEKVKARGYKLTSDEDLLFDFASEIEIQSRLEAM